MKLTPCKIKKFYQDAIFRVFGIDDDDPIFKKENKRLKRAIKEGVHLGKKAPGQYATWSILEIYCENGIPNATDVNDFSAEAIEFGFDPAAAVCYNSDRWAQVDALVNLLTDALGNHERYYHEPYNDAVVNIFQEPPF